MTFKWNDPEIKSLLFAYTFFGMLMLGPFAWRVVNPICTLGADYASGGFPEPPLWDRPFDVAIAAGIGGLLGFAFVVSVLFTFAYIPERLISADVKNWD